MVRYPRNLIARTVSRHLTVFMSWWLYKIPGAYSMPTDLLAKSLARAVTLYLVILVKKKQAAIVIPKVKMRVMRWLGKWWGEEDTI